MAGKEKLFMDACKKKFKEEPTDMSTKYYCYGGWKQSKSKVEFQKAADEIAKKRGIPCSMRTSECLSDRGPGCPTSCPTQTSTLRQMTCTA